MTKSTKNTPVKNPLVSLNGQLMVMAAHRYCLGRQTYIVGACTEWLRANWDVFEPNTKRVMLRDTIEALQDGTAGGACDATNWTNFAEWAFEKLSPEDKDWVKGAVAHRHQEWPLKEVARPAFPPNTFLDGKSPKI